MPTVEDLTKLIVAKGEEIKKLKADKVDKEALAPHIAELLSLKEQFKVVNNGVPFDPPKVEPPKKEKAPAPEPVQRDGPSKKELNKMARKEARKGGNNKDDASEGNLPPPVPPAAAPTAAAAPTKPAATPAAVPPAVSAIPAVAPIKLPSVKGPTVFYCAGNHSLLPELVQATVPLLGLGTAVTLTPSPEAATGDHLPVLVEPEQLAVVSGDSAIARYLTRTAGAVSLVGGADALQNSLVDQWLEYYTVCTAGNDQRDLSALAVLLDAYFSDKTYAVGHSRTLADIALVVLLRRAKFAANPAALPHVSRWFSLASQGLANAVPLYRDMSKVGNKGAAASGGASAKGGDKSKGDASAADAEGDGGSCPPLEGAVEGKVCTRFPPEPSGYLHLGHAKAVLLNQYYAQRYKGKLIVRFDDTNPSKEKDEFEENIIHDLATLGVKADQVTHTSDSFAKCEELARKMISEGKAYMDDTDQETMQAERMEKKESCKRNTTPQENLAIFEKLLKGEPDAQKYCLRAKIDMTSVNGTLRDPVLYRFNETPHHRTGTKYKAYPTYDFACPIVDSIEGVTHALRTTEYNDRDEQYQWIQQALGLRPVTIYSFGKMNFVNTVLSKRKLNWFVENKLVEGWFDPRFPTIQGCVRRGVNVDALKNFIISQGASRRVITMEWDKFWSENKKVLEETAARYMGVNTKDVVPFNVTNIPDEITCTSVQIHPQKPEHGMRVMRKYKRILVGQIDAVTFKEGEEVTFLRWGNFFIDEIVKDASGKVLSMQGRFHPEATNFSKTKKTTWLAETPDLVLAKVFEFDHLISKAKLEENDSFEDHLNPVTKVESEALCDPCLRSVNAGQVIQLERKGFFRCDQPYGGPSKPIILFAIPDGKQKPGAAAAAPAPAAKGGKKK